MLGAEVGGRLSVESLDILRELARCKARDAPRFLKAAAAQAWHSRWLNMLSVSIQVSCADGLLQPSSGHRTELDGWTPSTLDLVTGSQLQNGEGASRLPLRG